MFALAAWLGPHATHRVHLQIQAVTRKLDYYKNKIATLKQRDATNRQQLVMHATRAEELAIELEEERDHNADDPVRGLRHRSHTHHDLNPKRRDGANRQRRDNARQLYAGFDLLDAEGEADDVKNLLWTQRLARRIERQLKRLYPLSQVRRSGLSA